MFPCYTDQFEKRPENSAQIQSSEFEIKNPGRCNPFFFFFLISPRLRWVIFVYAFMLCKRRQQITEQIAQTMEKRHRT